MAIYRDVCGTRTAFIHKDSTEGMGMAVPCFAGVINQYWWKHLRSIFGSESFVARIKEKYYFDKKHYEVPESKRLASDTDKIISIMCRYYGVTFEDLLVSRRGVFNKPRNVAVYLI